MTRQILEFPKTQQEWDNLPTDFMSYLDLIDEARLAKSQQENSFDPLYPTYDYLWEVDDTLPLETVIYYWNMIEVPLVDPNTIVEEIQEALVEDAWDDYNSSYYSA